MQVQIIVQQNIINQMSENIGNRKCVRVGSRKSQLALIQTHSVIACLKECNPSVEFEVVPMTTTGDNILDTALSKIGEKSLFTRELETALLQHDVDFIVHSLKDLPTELPNGLVIGAVCKRDDPRDALVLNKSQLHNELESLPEGSVIGTSSLRRAAQLQRKFSHLQIVDIRGNLNTRLRKLDDTASVYTGLVLAAAGLERMGWNDRISNILPTDVCMYAVGQGAMAVECRSDDIDILSFLSVLTDHTTLLRCIAERSFLRQLEGGCSVPVAVNSEFCDDQLTLCGGVFSIGGTEAVIDTQCVHISHKHESYPQHKWPVQHFAAMTAPSTVASIDELTAAHTLGISLAKKLLENGAEEILTATKRQMAQEIIRLKAEKSSASGDNNGNE